MNDIITNDWAGLVPFQSYEEYKSNLDFEIKANAEGFVRIGYLLKVARDTEILKESGYKNVAEFAQAEYGLTKDIVSRYIAINDRFSIDGYSDKLLTQFEGFGVAKLAEMLTLPDSIVEEIKPSLTRHDIQEIKKEVAEEAAVTPLEVAIEATTAKAVKEDTDYPLPLRIWKNYFETAKENYKKLGSSNEYRDFYVNQNERMAEDFAAKALADILAPNGDAVLWSRVPGVGKIMISFSESEDEITMTNVRTGTKDKHSLASALSDIMDLFGEMTAKEWEEVYGTPFEEPEPEPAPKPERKPEPKPAKKETKPAPKPEKKEHPKPVEIPISELGLAAESEPIKEYQTKLITNINDVAIGDKLVNTSNGDEGTVLGVFNGTDLKVSTDHGIILVGVPSYDWSILEPEPETPEEDEEAAGSNTHDLSEVAPVQQDEDHEGELQELKENILDCEHELEEVFKDAWADGMTIDGMKSCLVILENLRHQMERLLRYKVIEEASDDED